MAIHSKYLETLEAVIATALNIVKNRPLADLYVRKDYMGHFRIRVQLESGQRYVITIRDTHAIRVEFATVFPPHKRLPTARYTRRQNRSCMRSLALAKI